MAADVLERVAAWTGWALDADQLSLLDQYADWLVTEATVAGGVGPNEADRVRERHLGDSLLFAGAWTRPDPPASVADLGSGVGLPGIPLAIQWPEALVTLVERSRRRVDLLHRVRRVLGLTNLEILAVDAAAVELEADLVVARAAAGAESVREWGRRLVRPGGVVVIGGSHVHPPVAIEGEAILAVPATILDHPVWLRMMASS